MKYLLLFIIIINSLLISTINCNSENQLKNKIQLNEKFLGTYDKKTKKFKLGFCNSGKRIYTSSSINNKYKAENMIDSNLNTCWATSINGGISEQFLIVGKKNIIYPNSIKGIKGIYIYNGYCKNKKLYYKNNRIKKLNINIYRIIEYPQETDNGLIWYTFNKDINLIKTKKVNLPDKYLYENKIYFDIDLDKDFNKTLKEKGITPDYYFLFTIEDIYKGTKYNDLCVSEIKFIYK